MPLKRFNKLVAQNVQHPYLKREHLIVERKVLSLQEQLQSAVAKLVESAKRLEAAGETITQKQSQLVRLREENRELQSALNQAEQNLLLMQKNEADMECIQLENAELINERNHLIAQKEQLINEREQFEKFRQDMEKERLNLIREKEEALAQLKENQSDLDSILLQQQNEMNHLREDNGRLNVSVTALQQEKELLIAQKNQLTEKLESVRQAYNGLRQTVMEAYKRLDSTLEELKELRG